MYTAQVKIYLMIIVQIHRNEHEFYCDDFLWPSPTACCVCLGSMGGFGVERLSDEEVAFFKTYGYLVKESVLDPDLVATARELWWSKCPSAYVRADDPESWIGGFDGPVHIRSHYCLDA
eukprot:COSAG02_NODE_741_length_17813_cov_51.487863_13_plen_119_part_00